jgi:hypothetical protein
MAKTKPIGVRFDEDLLNEFKLEKLADTPQGALSLLENYYKTAKLTINIPIRKITSILEVENEKIAKINTPSKEASDKPIRRQGESSLDFRLREAEWVENNKNK